MLPNSWCKVSLSAKGPLQHSYHDNYTMSGMYGGPETSSKEVHEEYPTQRHASSCRNVELFHDGCCVVMSIMAILVVPARAERFEGARIVNDDRCPPGSCTARCAPNTVSCKISAFPKAPNASTTPQLHGTPQTLQSAVEPALCVQSGRATIITPEGQPCLL